MKLKALLLTSLAAGLLVSAAVAASPAKKPTPTPGADTTQTTTAAAGTSHGKGAKPACKPARKLVLKGEFVSAGAGGFALKVTGGNHGAKAWKDKQATVLVDEKTRFQGKKRALADLVAGDRVNVQGLACKADAAATSLLARKVMVKGPKGEQETADTEPATTTTP